MKTIISKNNTVKYYGNFAINKKLIVYTKKF